jgi:hypothetical protein
MKWRCVLWFTLALMISGCAPEPLPFEEVADVNQLMLTVIDPAADVYWESVATIMDMDGTREIAPSTAEEWEAVRNAAMIVAESGNLLLMPGRAQEGEQWTELAQALITSGRQALIAAEARDPAAVFNAGGELYLVCSDCHAAFAPEALRSSFLSEE